MSMCQQTVVHAVSIAGEVPSENADEPSSVQQANNDATHQVSRVFRPETVKWTSYGASTPDDWTPKMFAALIAVDALTVHLHACLWFQYYFFFHVEAA